MKRFQQLSEVLTDEQKATFINRACHRLTMEFNGSQPGSNVSGQEIKAWSETRMDFVASLINSDMKEEDQEKWVKSLMTNNMGHDHLELLKDIEVGYRLKSCQQLKKCIMDMVNLTKHENRSLQIINNMIDKTGTKIAEQNQQIKDEIAKEISIAKDMGPNSDQAKESRATIVKLETEKHKQTMELNRLKRKRDNLKDPSRTEPTYAKLQSSTTELQELYEQLETLLSQDTESLMVSEEKKGTKKKKPIEFSQTVRKKIENIQEKANQILKTTKSEFPSTADLLQTINEDDKDSFTNKIESDLKNPQPLYAYALSESINNYFDAYTRINHVEGEGSMSLTGRAQLPLQTLSYMFRYPALALKGWLPNPFLAMRDGATSAWKESEKSFSKWGPFAIIDLPLKLTKNILLSPVRAGIYMTTTQHHGEKGRDRRTSAIRQMGQLDAKYGRHIKGAERSDAYKSLQDKLRFDS